MRPTYNRNAILKGYRSGLEDKIAKQIEDEGFDVIYEKEKIKYVVPSRQASYTPDFKIVLPDGAWFYVESKGIFNTQDRHKHLLLKDQHPDIQIRFVFSNSRSKIYKRSPTSYADWCNKHGFLYADKLIPQEWFKLPSPPSGSEPGTT